MVTTLKLKLPKSKSIVSRILMIEALSGKRIFNQEVITCNDSKLLSQILLSKNEEIDVKDSGTAMRFMTAYLAQKSGEWVLTCSERTMERPIGKLVDALRKLGADIDYLKNDGFLPIKIYGKQLNSDLITIDASESSQFISALMLIAPYLSNGLSIKLNGVNSYPYILLTRQVMSICGADVKVTNRYIKISNQKYSPRTINVESDWSAAAFWFAFLTLSKQKNLILTDFFTKSMQTDKVAKKIFSIFGIKSSIRINYLFLSKEEVQMPKKYEYNFKNCPDLVPIMVAVCCQKNIPFIFTGVKNLKIKESNRIMAIITEMKKLGFVICEIDDTLVWNGKTCEKNIYPIIETHNDHRIAMLFALMSLNFNLKILTPEVTDKSYWNFWHDFEKVKQEAEDL